MSAFIISVAFVVVFFFVLEIVILTAAKLLGVYTVVQEREAKIFVLFGNVLGVIDEPGLHFLWGKFGWKAILAPLLGQVHRCDLRMDQEYQRSTPVNSEEGAPMGIGVWYEMYINDPLAHVFKNADPRGSLRANVGNAAVKCLSNMPLTDMLASRHKMSLMVRQEVSIQSVEWGYQLGSVYIRKVHFRDVGMIRQIEEKVVNRLRQVTSAIKQDGVNQVNLIASAAEREAAVAFAEAAVMRPKIVGAALQLIAKDKEVAEALFTILETEQIIESKAAITLLPAGLRSDLLGQLEASGTGSAVASGMG
jgi:regulator of protease activity HflC (stomatin/prohibitin superfamily)